MNLQALLAYIGDRVRTGIANYNSGLRVREAISQVAQEAKLVDDVGTVYDNEGIVQFNPRVVDVYLNTPAGMTFDFSGAPAGAAVFLGMEGDAPSWPAGSNVVGTHTPGASYYVVHKGGGAVAAVKIDGSYLGKFDTSGDLIAAHPAPLGNAYAIVGTSVTGLAFWGWDGTAWAAGSSVAPVDSVNGQTGAVVLDPDDLDDAATAHKFVDQATLDFLASQVSQADAEAGVSAASALWSPLRVAQAIAAFLVANPQGQSFRSYKMGSPAGGTLTLPSAAQAEIPIFYFEGTDPGDTIVLPSTTWKNSYVIVADSANGITVRVDDPDAPYFPDIATSGFSVQVGAGFSYVEMPMGSYVMFVGDDSNNRYTAIFFRHPSAGGGGTLAGLSDTTIPAPVVRQALVYSGAVWVNQFVPYQPQVYWVTGGQTTVVQNIPGADDNLFIIGRCVGSSGTARVNDMPNPYYMRMRVSNSHESDSDLILTLADNISATGVDAWSGPITAGGNGDEIAIPPGESVLLIKIPTEKWGVYDLRDIADILMAAPLAAAAVTGPYSGQITTIDTTSLPAGTPVVVGQIHRSGTYLYQVVQLTGTDAVVWRSYGLPDGQSAGDQFRWNGSEWVLATAFSLPDGQAAGDVLEWNGAEWVPGASSGGGGSSIPFSGGDLAILADELNWAANGSLSSAAQALLGTPYGAGDFHAHLAENAFYFSTNGSNLVRMALVGGTFVPSGFDILAMADLYFLLDATVQTGWVLSGNAIDAMIDQASGFKVPKQLLHSDLIGSGGTNQGFSVANPGQILQPAAFNRHIIQAAAFNLAAGTGGEVDQPVVAVPADFTFFVKIKHANLANNYAFFGGGANGSTGLRLFFNASGMAIWNNGVLAATIACPTAENETDTFIYVLRRNASNVISLRRAKDNAGDGNFAWENGGSTYSSASSLAPYEMRMNNGSELRYIGLVAREVTGAELTSLETELETV